MMLLYVFSIRLTTAANAIFLEFTAPIYVVILSYYLLNERITLFDIVSMVIIFFGIFRYTGLRWVVKVKLL